jgi:hypothetical protein
MSIVTLSRSDNGTSFTSDDREMVIWVVCMEGLEANVSKDVEILDRKLEMTAAAPVSDEEKSVGSVRVGPRTMER